MLAYRPEVDGLRAIAVAAVLLFHAQLGPLPGGFAGVDVFFVISGFLITGIVLREQAEGRFTLAGFYARRARRILPALYVVGAACVPAALLLLTGDALADFFRTLAAAAVGGSNFVFAATTDYFGQPAEGRPLLHTWSLGVEEQFYLVFPLFLLVAAKWPRRRVVTVLALAALASLAGAEWASTRYSTANFFLAPGRAWELAAGCLCAFAVARREGGALSLPRPLQESIAWLGLAAVLASFALFDRTTRDPSAWMLLPVLGTAALLLAADTRTSVGRVLASRPFVAVGLVSYSAYLWHQPLLVFSRIHVGGPLPLAWRLAIVAATFLLAGLTWRFVEQPLRTGWRAPVPRTLRVAALACATVTAAALGGMVAASAYSQPFPAVVRAQFEPPARAADCFDVPGAHAQPDAWCRINPSVQPLPGFVLFGDSHALQLLDAFEAAARQAGRSGVFVGYSGCPPLLGVVPLTRPDQGTRDCAALNRRVLDFVREQRIRDVYLVGKWSYSTDLWNGTRYLNALGFAAGDPVDVGHSRRAFEQGFAQTVQAYAAAGVRLHVIEQVPQQQVAPRAAYERAWREPARAAQVLEQLAVPVASHAALQAFPRQVLRRADLPARETLDFTPLLCDAQRCSLGEPRLPYYTDESHVSPAGAARLVPALAASLARQP